VAQALEHLPNKCEALSSNPSMAKKKKKIAGKNLKLTVFALFEMPEFLRYIIKLLIFSMLRNEFPSKI
jgi:hypothetical protein